MLAMALRKLPPSRRRKQQNRVMLRHFPLRSVVGQRFPFPPAIFHRPCLVFPKYHHCSLILVWIDSTDIRRAWAAIRWCNLDERRDCNGHSETRQQVGPHQTSRDKWRKCNPIRKYRVVYFCRCSDCVRGVVLLAMLICHWLETSMKKCVSETANLSFHPDPQKRHSCNCLPPTVAIFEWLFFVAPVHSLFAVPLRSHACFRRLHRRRSLTLLLLAWRNSCRDKEPIFHIICKKSINKKRNHR